MKVLRTKQEIDEFNKLRSKAREGCDKCPGCGKSKSSFDWTDYKIYSKFDFSGFKKKTLRIDRYICECCDSVWESDPYELLDEV